MEREITISAEDARLISIQLRLRAADLANKQESNPTPDKEQAIALCGRLADTLRWSILSR